MSQEVAVAAIGAALCAGPAVALLRRSGGQRRAAALGLLGASPPGAPGGVAGRGLWRCWQRRLLPARGPARTRVPWPRCRAGAVPEARGPGRRGGDEPRRIAVALLVGCAAAVLAGGAVGAVLGGLAAALAHRLLPRLPSPQERAASRIRRLAAAQLPLAADLLAACSAVGGEPAGAVGAVADALPAPVGPLLGGVAAQLRLGADPAEAWSGLAAEHAVLAPLGRCLERAALSGAPPAGALARLADAQRAELAAAAQAAVRRVGVLATLPLGLCFLPAFLLTGVVPTVAGLASGFLGRL